MEEAKKPEETSALYAEHVLLGAQFNDDGAVVSYAYEHGNAFDDARGGTSLADISYITTLLYSGEGSSDFVHAAFGGKELAVGECAFEAALTGDGTVASIPLLARTGAEEYVAFDLSSRSEVLGGWLAFLKSVSKDGFSPFSSVQATDATGTHTVLTLWGEGATRILSDYTDREALPKCGQIASCTLDKLPCIIARLPFEDIACYMILVPPRISVVLWRSLLSFPDVNPVGLEGIALAIRAWLPWYDHLHEADQVRMGEQELLQAGLIRSTLDFVGGRGL